MTPLIDYWLKANLFLLLFYGCYALLLRRHTFLTLNRTYLLGSLVLALLLPLVHIPGLAFPWPWETTDVPVYATVSAEAITVAGPVTEAEPPLLPDWPVLAQWAVALVAMGLLFRTGWRTISLLRLIQQWPAQRFADHTLVLPPAAQTPTFSFFRYLVLNPDDAQTEAVRQHELVHIRQKHSVDVLLLEVIQALCWPNPALFGYRQAIRQVHEYLADRDATPQTPTHRDAYARFLVNYAFHLPECGTTADSLAHSFGPDRPDSPTLKQRIQMLYQQHTRRRALWKYALVLPLATALLAMTTEPDSTHEFALDLSSSLPTEPMVHVEGVIKNQFRRPLPGANVVVKNGHRGTTTDINGHFIIDVPANTTLVASYVGYSASEMPISEGRKMVVVFILRPSSVDGTTMPMVDTPISSVTVPAPDGSNEVFTVVESNPTFPGGTNAMTVFITSNLRYPARAKRANIQGKVLLNFLVGTNGAISQIKVIKGIQFGCDDEAIRLVKEMPKWTPGMQNGRPVAVRYNLQVDFALANKVGSNQKPEPAVRVGYSPMDSIVAPIATTIQMTDRIRLPGDDKNSVSFDLYSKGNVVYILDGKEITKAQMSKLDPNSIQNMTVLKDEFEPVFYKGITRDGIIRITSKKGNKAGLKKPPVLNLPTSQMDYVVKNSPHIYYNGNTTLVDKSRFSYQTKDSVKIGKGQIKISAPTSTSANELSKALWFIDGKESNLTDVQALAPNDIQSIDILKGKEATSLYGEKGQFGVIRVTSRKGSGPSIKKDR